MHKAQILEVNGSQTVELPAEVGFPEDVKDVYVRKMGRDLVLSPVDGAWDSFFLDGPKVSDDFLPERASQHQDEREEL